jgi:peptide/nickel transport system substrate-binding protein
METKMMLIKRRTLTAKSPRSKSAAGAVLATTALLISLSSGVSSAASKSPSGPLKPDTVVVGVNWGGLWPCTFNPFTSPNTAATFGSVYEPLMFVDELTNKISPWLATSYQWSDKNTDLTFTIRSGVKWSSGVPFTAADVVFTFEMLKKNPALDLNGVWSVLSDVRAVGTNKVSFTFKSAESSFLFYIADQVPIVPKYIWSKVPNPVSYADKSAIGTGAYVISACTAENLTETKNPIYWQKGLPKITTVQLPAFTSNGPANDLLASGQANWGGEYIPNEGSFYLSKSSYYHAWYPALATHYLIINLKTPLLSNVAVRKAMVFALDPATVARLGEDGEAQAQNQEGVTVPALNSWIDKPLVQKYDYH